MRPRLESFDGEGEWLDHDSLASAIDSALGGFPSFEEVEAADARMQRALTVPADVKVFDLSLEVA